MNKTLKKSLTEKLRSEMPEVPSRVLFAKKRSLRIEELFKLGPKSPPKKTSSAILMKKRSLSLTAKKRSMSMEELLALSPKLPYKKASGIRLMKELDIPLTPKKKK